MVGPPVSWRTLPLQQVRAAACTWDPPRTLQPRWLNAAQSSASQAAIPQKQTSQQHASEACPPPPHTHTHRYKWDLIKSVVKSATGLQRTKLQELQIPTFASLEEAGVELRASGQRLRANLRSLLRLKPGAGGGMRGGVAGAEQGGEEEERAAEAGGEGAAGGGAAAADELELRRHALLQRQHSQKAAMLLGNVPALVRLPAMGGVAGAPLAAY